ncbi:MAG TPA: hypothetical protein VHJ77_08700 [Vicinamibacterales bacterium]|jgi:hypothetical protein|nr:hypothetical protein [Vicinamibacterales bacterium]
MNGVVSLTLAVACVAVVVQPARRLETRGEPVIGLLTLPEVFGSGPCDRFKPKEINLYETPDESKPVGTIRVDKYWRFLDEASCEGLEVRVHRPKGGGVSELPYEEHEYEDPAAIVLQQRDRWFRVRLSDGSAWLRASDSAEYLPLSELLQREMAHLTDSWDGVLFAEANGSTRVSVPRDPRRRMVGYLVTDQEKAEPPTWISIFKEPGDAASIGRFQINHSGSAVEIADRSPWKVLIFDRRPGWYQVALRRDGWWNAERAWIQEGLAWQFRELKDDVERERLAEEAWGREQLSARVASYKEVNGRLWLDVELWSHSICERVGEEPAFKARGWMPAHAASGEPAIWFSARGC